MTGAAITAVIAARHCTGEITNDPRAAYKGHKAYVASVRCNRKLRAAERIEMNCGGRKR